MNLVELELEIRLIKQKLLNSPMSAAKREQLTVKLIQLMEKAK